MRFFKIYIAVIIIFLGNNLYSQEQMNPFNSDLISPVPTVGYTMNGIHNGYSIGFGARHYGEIWGSEILALLLGFGPKFSYYGSFTHYPQGNHLGFQVDANYSYAFFAANIHNEFVFKNNQMQYTFSPQLGASIMFFDVFVGPGFKVNSFTNKDINLNIKAAIRVPLLLFYY